MTATSSTSQTPDPDVLASLGGAPRPRWQAWLIRLGLLVIVAGAATWAVQRYMEKKALAAQPRYSTQPAEKRDLHVTVGATGTLAGLNTVEVGSEISGKVTELLVDFNDRVEHGMIIARIDPEQPQASVDEARANVTSADAAVLESQATLEEARLNAERGEAQLASGLISKQQYESLQATAKRAQAALTRARATGTLSRASLKSAESNLAKTEIRSPIDGVVQSRSVEVGQTLSAGMSTPVLFKLTEDLAKMRLSVAIDEADVGRVAEGQEASFTVDAFPERIFKSKVVSLRNEPSTDQNVVTYEAILSVDNEAGLLRPGMTATATIITETKKAVLSVPNAALRFSMPSAPQTSGFGPPDRKPKRAPTGDTPGVWVLRDSKAVRVSAKVGATDGRYSEIVTPDLHAGDAVIIDAETQP